MSEFIARNLVIIGILAILIFISLVSIPLIIIAIKNPLLFSGIFSKRALVFSLANAALITLILISASVFIGFIIADENAGTGMIMLIRLSLAVGLTYGFTFSYLIIYILGSARNK